jgi:hypothetical protein
VQSLPAQVTAPCRPCVKLWIVSGASPSTSKSLASTLAEPGEPSVVEMTSATAVGSSCTGVTVIETVAVSVPPWPSEIVYVNESGPK